MELVTFPHYTPICPSPLQGWKHSGDLSEARVVADKASCTVYGLFVEGLSIALKRYRNLPPRPYRKVQYEVTVTSSLNHPHVLPLYGAYDHQGDTYLFSPLAECSLMNLLSQPHCKFTERKLVVEQVGKGLQYLHSKRILHRDIKLENILLLEDRLVLSDLGEVVQIDNPPENLMIAGTAMYFPPEVAIISANKTANQQALLDILTFKTDVYSFGITLFALDFDFYPFDLEMPHEEYNQLDDVHKIIATCKLFAIIKEAQLPFDEDISADARAFYSHVLAKNSDDRMTLDEMLSHPYVTGEPVDIQEDAEPLPGSDAQLVRDIRLSSRPPLRKTPSEPALDALTEAGRHCPVQAAKLGGEFSMEDLLDDSAPAKAPTTVSSDPVLPALSCRSMPLVNAHSRAALLAGLPKLSSVDLPGPLGHRRNNSTDSLGSHLGQSSHRSRPGSTLDLTELKTPRSVADVADKLDGSWTGEDSGKFQEVQVETTYPTGLVQSPLGAWPVPHMAAPSAPLAVKHVQYPPTTMETVMEDEMSQGGRQASWQMGWLRRLSQSRNSRSSNEDERDSNTRRLSSDDGQDGAYTHMSLSPYSSGSLSMEEDSGMAGPSSAPVVRLPGTSKTGALWLQARRLVGLSPSNSVVRRT